MNQRRIACRVTAHVAGARIEHIRSLDQRPRELRRVALGFSVCVWLVVHPFISFCQKMLPLSEPGFTLALRAIHCRCSTSLHLRMPYRSAFVSLALEFFLQHSRRSFVAINRRYFCDVDFMPSK
jgi:hypothetical protein